MDFRDRVSLAAVYMKQANVGLAAKSLFSSDPISSSTYRRQGDSFHEVLGNASMIHFNWENCLSYQEAYFLCPPLSAIINRKAQNYTNGESYIINTAGKAKNQEATGEVASKIRKLMARPNRLQTGDEFEAQNYIYTQTFGYCLVLAMKPVGFPWYEADEIWNVPPSMLTITEKQGLFFKGTNSTLESVMVSYGGESAYLPLDNVAIIRDIMPSFFSVLIPDSRVKTLKMPINNIVGAYESRNMLINSRGALGMLTNQTQDSSSFINLKPDEKETLYDDFKKMYGLRKGQSHVIITSANLKWQPMVLPTKDLMLFEEIEDDGNRICDAYMFPPELFAKMSGGTTFSNMATATRNLYQDAIMPEAKNIYSQWNKIFETQTYNLEIGREYGKLPALQAANKEEAEASLRLNQSNQIAFRNNVITLNEWRISMKKDPIAGGDVYYSDIKDKLAIQYQNGEGPSTLDETFIGDNINPGAGNDGTPNQQNHGKGEM
jgi:hypothetical protein